MAKTATQVGDEFRDHGHSRSVADFAASDLLTSRSGTFPLVDADHRAAGIATLSQIWRLPRNLWDSTTLTDGGTPITEMIIAHPDDRLVDVLASMGSPDGRIVVVDPAG
jgi:hypothetical protein